MNELLKKYWLLAVLGVVLLVFLAKRGSSGGGASTGPDYNTVTNGVDVSYEAIKSQTQLGMAAIAGQAYGNLLDYQTAHEKLLTDEHLASIEGQYSLNIASVGADLARYQSDVAARIAASQAMEESYRASLTTGAQNLATTENNRTARRGQLFDFFGGMAHNVLAFLGG